MKSERSARCLPILLLLLSASTVAAASQAPSTPAPSHGVQHDPQSEAAFDHFYNMEYDRAIPELEKIVEKSPNDPLAVNHLLTAVLMRDLYETGGMNTGDWYFVNVMFAGSGDTSTGVYFEGEWTTVPEPGTLSLMGLGLLGLLRRRKKV